MFSLYGLQYFYPTPFFFNRLPSIRGPRDLTLGGIPKKVFTPNIPSRRVKDEYVFCLIDSKEHPSLFLVTPVAISWLSAIQKRISSSRHVDNTNSFDSCYPFLLVITLEQVLQTALSICTKMMNIGFCWSTNTDVCMCRSL